MSEQELFDYVVIGGGSSGSVVASRLAAAARTVLVLEAGGTDRRPDVVVPAGVASAYKRCNWKYPVEPDPTRQSAPEVWMAGRVLGGGGSINSCVFVRGNRADYEGWAASGAKGWDYQAVLPSFKRMETWEGGDDGIRGGSGPISVGIQTDHGLANSTYFESALQAGHPQTPDYNGERQDGVAYGQVNHRRGKRSQASREYLRKVAPRNSITVRTKAFVNRIMLRDHRAVGVEYVRRGQTRIAHAREEVILSAGTLASPKILNLSGIGDRSELNAFNIETVVNLPGVGKNLQEHAYVIQRWHSRVPTINKPRPGTVGAGLRDYALHGTGPLAMTMVQVQVMCKSGREQPVPDLQLHFVPFAITHDTDANGMFTVSLAKDEGFIASSIHMHPRARGTVGLRSADPRDNPRIAYQFFADVDDLRDSVKGVRAAQEIMAQPAMAAIAGDPFEPERSCGPDADWMKYVQATATPAYHPVGTCKMGVDDQAVVDPELRVFDVAGLRVVDASVMPTVTSGNTNAPSMMIGERAAELILGPIS
jgi:choline dehydrogenase